MWTLGEKPDWHRRHTHALGSLMGEVDGSKTALRPCPRARVQEIRLLGPAWSTKKLRGQGEQMGGWHKEYWEEKLRLAVAGAL